MNNTQERTFTATVRFNYGGVEGDVVKHFEYTCADPYVARVALKQWIDASVERACGRLSRHLASAHVETFVDPLAKPPNRRELGDQMDDNRLRTRSPDFERLNAEVLGEHIDTRKP